AGVNELLDTGVLCRNQKIFCAAYVGLVNILGALGPQAVIGGDVKDSLHTIEGALKRGGITQVAGDVFERKIGDSAIVTRSAQQHAHGIAARHELAGDVTSEEAGGASDQSSHAVWLKPTAQAEFAGLECERAVLPCFLRLVAETCQCVERKGISVQVILQVENA